MASTYMTTSTTDYREQNIRTVHWTSEDKPKLREQRRPAYMTAGQIYLPHYVMYFSGVATPGHTRACAHVKFTGANVES